jgi:nucleotide-binding universal stress UspA family protein
MMLLEESGRDYNKWTMKFGKILASVNGDEADTEAVELACKISRGSKSKLYVIYIIQVERNLPLDADISSEIQGAEKVLNHAEDVAEEQDCEVETEVLQARDVGAALVYEAVERGVDVIVMSMSYKKRFGEFSLGSVIPHVLKNTPCPVLLFRKPIP